MEPALKYSVLMSVYFKEKAEFLQAALDSIWKQTVQTDDFVLVCDGPLTKELLADCFHDLMLASSDPACLRGLGDSFPARVCLKVSTPQDSHALLNQKGGESLPRKGSLYYLDGIDPDPQYLQCGFISQREIRSVIDALASNYVNIRKRSIFEEIEDDDPEYGASESGKKKSRRPHQS